MKTKKLLILTLRVKWPLCITHCNQQKTCTTRYKTYSKYETIHRYRRYDKTSQNGFCLSEGKYKEIKNKKQLSFRFRLGKLTLIIRIQCPRSPNKYNFLENSINTSKKLS